MYQYARSSQPKPCQDNRGAWRIGTADVEAYIEEAYRKTAEKISRGGFVEEEVPED